LRTLKEVWWWENPYPDFDPEKSWNRYLVKNSDEGGKAHHDQIFGDFDGDGEIDKDTDNDIIVSGKSGLYIIENMKY